ncbi:hypothetical protein, partial [Corynebacterium coyleae]|uniref:hypothetical protein n=1 Tax=Corynebacterium coyleae TaxID=53374 RepID=UPI001C60AB88
QSQQRTRKVAYFFTLKRTKTGRRNGLLPKPNWTTYIRSDTALGPLLKRGELQPGWVQFSAEESRRQ